MNYKQMFVFVFVCLCSFCCQKSQVFGMLGCCKRNPKILDKTRLNQQVLSEGLSSECELECAVERASDGILTPATVAGQTPAPDLSEIRPQEDAVEEVSAMSQVPLLLTFDVVNMAREKMEQFVCKLKEAEAAGEPVELWADCFRNLTKQMRALGKTPESRDSIKTMINVMYYEYRDIFYNRLVKYEQQLLHLSSSMEKAEATWPNYRPFFNGMQTADCDCERFSEIAQTIFRNSKRIWGALLGVEVARRLVQSKYFESFSIPFQVKK